MVEPPAAMTRRPESMECLFALKVSSSVAKPSTRGCESSKRSRPSWVSSILGPFRSKSFASSSRSRA